MSLILHVRGPMKPVVLLSLFGLQNRFLWLRLDRFLVGVFFFSMPDTISVSQFSLWIWREKESREDFNCSPLIHISPTTFISSSSPPLKGAGEYCGQIFFFIIFGRGRGILSWDGAHLWKGWWWRIKGWGREIGVCVCMDEAVCASVCLCVCVCLRICVRLMGRGWVERASNPRGVCDWEGNGELGLGECEVEVEEGEKKEAGGWYRKCRGGRMKRANYCSGAGETHNYAMWGKTSTFFKVCGRELCLQQTAEQSLKAAESGCALIKTVIWNHRTRPVLSLLFKAKRIWPHVNTFLLITGFNAP